LPTFCILLLVFPEEAYLFSRGCCAGKRVAVESLKGKRVAVDASIWIAQVTLT
jgi:hypothetical protein